MGRDLDRCCLLLVIARWRQSVSRLQSHGFLSLTGTSSTERLRQQYINNEVHDAPEENRLPLSHHALFITFLPTPWQRECINVKAVIVTSKNSQKKTPKENYNRTKASRGTRETMILHTESNFTIILLLKKNFHLCFLKVSIRWM